MKPTPAEKAETALRAVALGFPEAYEDHPWGDTVFKVKGKIFLFMGTASNNGFGLSAKLPLSNSVALMLPFTEPTRYGLGKSGWVSARFGPKDEIPLDMLSAWVDESYRSVAPKKLAASLPPAGAAGAGESEAKKSAAKPTSKKAIEKKAPAGKKITAKAPAKKAPDKKAAAAKKAAPAKKAAAAKKAAPAKKAAASKPAAQKASAARAKAK